MLWNKLGKMAALLLLSLSVAACSAEKPATEATGEGGTTAKTGGKLNVAINTQPSTLDPVITTTFITRDMTKNIFETLVTLDSKYNVVPMLAESIHKSDDGKTYTFPLRKGVKFHNGKEMKAEDVVASMNRWKDVSARAREMLRGGTFEAKDDYTVVLKLNEPSIGALNALTVQTQPPAIMPKEIVQAASAKGANELIGTGPFKFAEWKKDQYIHLTRYADYKPLASAPDGLSGKKEALVDDVFFHIVTDTSTREIGVKTGEYDIAIEMSRDSYDSLKGDKSVKVFQDSYGSASLVFNMKQGVFSNLKMRQAVSYALDMDKILLAGLTNKDFYKLNSGYMLKEQSDWNSTAGDAYYNKKDTEKAKALLKEAGYNGQEIKLMTTRDFDYIYNEAIVIKEQLEQIGVIVKLDVVDWATLVSRRSDLAKYDMFVTAFSAVVTPMEVSYLNPDYPSIVKDDKVTSLMNAITTSATKEEAKKKWDELQAYAWSDYLPIVKLGDMSNLTVTTSKVEGFKTFLGMILWNTSVTK